MASDTLQDAGFSFQSHANDELAVAPAIFTTIYVTWKIKENKCKRILAAEEKWSRIVANYVTLQDL